MGNVAPKVNWLVNSVELGEEYEKLASEVFGTEPIEHKALLTQALEETEYRSWDWYNDGGLFKPRENAGDTSPRGYTIRGIKIEVRFNGYEDRHMEDTGFYGSDTVYNVIRFQKSRGLTPDGVIGPRTMKELCRKRVKNLETLYKILPGTAGQGGLLESDLYGACRNTTDDYSYIQLHNPLAVEWPDGNDLAPNDDWRFVYRVGVNFKYLCIHLAKSYERMRYLATKNNLTVSEDDLWNAAKVAHNVPAWAEEWLLAGFPESGGRIVVVGGWSGEKFQWTTLYKNAWNARVW
jgi:peptidoglycan hydrolase-like protein with peptidoglycan-binding domain